MFIQRTIFKNLVFFAQGANSKPALTLSARQGMLQFQNQRRQHYANKRQGKVMAIFIYFSQV